MILWFFPVNMHVYNFTFIGLWNFFDCSQVPVCWICASAFFIAALNPTLFVLCTVFFKPRHSLFKRYITINRNIKNLSSKGCLSLSLAKDFISNSA